MSIKKYLNVLLNSNNTSIINEATTDISDSALVLLYAIKDNNLFYVKMIKTSDLVNELEKTGFLKDNKVTKEGKSYLMLSKTKKRFNRIGE